MRYTWTQPGDDPSYDVGDKHDINGYFFPMFDALTTREILQDCKDRGHATGIYYGHNWGGTAPENATRAHEEYRRVYVPGLKVMFNWEQHKPDEIASGLETWRTLRPTVNTSWSMEGIQGGWMSPAFVKRIMETRVRWVPQAFAGDPMERRESDVVLRDLTRRGVPENIVSPFYMATDLGVGWDGWAFTLGLLPWP